MRNILWTDFILAASTGIVGCLFTDYFSELMGLSTFFVFWLSVVHCIYALFGLVNLMQKTLSPTLIKILIAANAFWSIISVGMLINHGPYASKFGVALLTLQIFIVGGLAIIENRVFRKM